MLTINTTLHISPADTSRSLAYSIVKRGNFRRRKARSRKSIKLVDRQCQNAGPPAISHFERERTIERRVESIGRWQEEVKEERGSYCYAMEKEREEARPLKGGEKRASEQQLHEIRQRAARNFRHKSHDPPTNFAGVNLFPRLSRERQRG